MSGSSLDGLDVAFVELDDSGGVWNYVVKAAKCVEYSGDWLKWLQQAKTLGAYAYLQLHSAFGKYIGEQVNLFIHENQLHHQVQLIASHGHTVFHAPGQGFTAQLGDGAAIAATTGINVVSDLRAMDVALGGQGAPIVPVGELLLWKGVDYFLNIGGIANISARDGDKSIAFDVCPANRVLNLLAGLQGLPYDHSGTIARAGTVDENLLAVLNGLGYYAAPYPKSLANEFGTDEVFPLVQSFGLSVQDALRTCVEHIAQQVALAAVKPSPTVNATANNAMVDNKRMLVTGGGALNNFLVERIVALLSASNISVELPPVETVQFKEAIVMALLGVLRWREENTVLNTVTGASRNSIGGAVWIGQEA